MEVVQRPIEDYSVKSLLDRELEPWAAKAFNAVSARTLRLLRVLLDTSHDVAGKLEASPELAGSTSNVENVQRSGCEAGGYERCRLENGKSRLR